MKKNLTEIVFILDRSGSMAGLEDDTIGGFNAMIQKQKAEDGEAYISTVLFDNNTEVIHDRVDIQKIQPMTREDYYVRGCTALLDAVGKSIHHIGNVHKYAREEDRPDKTIFVITTDGMENASRQYTYERVRQMIEHEKEKYGWEFLFLGANIDAAKEAARFGINEDCAANYHADRQGTAVIYYHVESCQETVPEAITAFLEGDSFEDVIRTAVSLGGDCDTLTCIAGSIAEGFYGVPEELKQECDDRIDDCMKEILSQFEAVCFIGQQS